MKFDCGESMQEKELRLNTWHPFFTILPRKIDSHDCRWLEWIERRSLGWYWGAGRAWEYRAKVRKNHDV